MTHFNQIMNQNKKTIAVLFGGASTEYGVSLQSAYAVISCMDTQKYNLVLIGISQTGKWFLYQGETKHILDDSWCCHDSCIPVVLSPDRELHGLFLLQSDGITTLPIDAAFPVLHGKNGEDGTVQGAFELAGIPVVGSGTLSSALCMDKEMAHSVASGAGVRVPLSFLATKATDKESLKEAAEILKYPLFVKPVRAGSSFGITKVYERSALDKAIEEAFCHDDRVIMEETISGFEVGCAVLGTEELIIGEVDEIELSQGFFNFTEKYTLQTSSIHVPARIDANKAAEIKQTALKLYRALDCSGFARVDLFLTPDGDIYFNEINTIPGFTSHSRYPSMMKAAGIGFEDLIERLIALSVEL